MPFTEPVNIPLTLLEDTVEQCWARGDDKALSMSLQLAEIKNALDAAAVTAQITNPGDVPAPDITVPMVNIPSEVSDAIETYKVQYLEMMEELSNRMALFKEEYFPDISTGYSSAKLFFEEALQNGGYGIPSVVVDKLMEDARSTAALEAGRATNNVMATFAARRFAVPPSQATAAVVMIQNKSQSVVAEASRNLAKLAVEFQKFSAEKLLDLRFKAESAALEYIKVLAVAPAESVKVTNQQSALISAAADFYRANISAAELVTKVEQFNNTQAIEVDSKNQAAELQNLSEKVKAMLAASQSTAQMATALYNNLNTSLSGAVSNTASLSHNYNYEG